MLYENKKKRKTTALKNASRCTSVGDVGCLVQSAQGGQSSAKFTCLATYGDVELLGLARVAAWPRRVVCRVFRFQPVKSRSVLAVTVLSLTSASGDALTLLADNRNWRVCPHVSGTRSV